MKTWLFRGAFASLCGCNFISVLDSVIISPALPVIASSLQATDSSIYWCGTAFLLTQAISQPAWATASEKLGRRVCLLWSMSIFMASSLLCATAQNVAWLIMARAAQGLGSGGNNALVGIAMTEVVDLSHRSKYQGYMAGLSAVAAVVGPVLGGVLAANASWRWIFYINLPICALLLLGIGTCLRLPKGEKTSRFRLDWVGVALLSASTASLLFGLTMGGVLYGWNTPNIIAPIVIGTAGIPIFVLLEAKIIQQPMLPMRIFQNRTAAVALISTFLHGYALWTVMYYLVLFFIIGKQRSILNASLAILPGVGTVPLTVVIAGLIVVRLKRFSMMNIMAWGFMIVGFGLTTLLTSSSDSGLEYGCQVLYSIGAGLLFLGRPLAMQASQADIDVPMATAMISFFSSIGQAFGVAIGGVVFNQSWQKHVGSCVNLDGGQPSTYRLPNHEGEVVIEDLSMYPPLVRDIYSCIAVAANRDIFIGLTVVSGIGFLVSLLSQDIRLDKDEQPLGLLGVPNDPKAEETAEVKPEDPSWRRTQTDSS